MHMQYQKHKPQTVKFAIVDLGCCQNYGPNLVIDYIRHLIFRGTKNETVVLGTTHFRVQGYPLHALFREKEDHPSICIGFRVLQSTGSLCPAESIRILIWGTPGEKLISLISTP